MTAAVEKCDVEALLSNTEIKKNSCLYKSLVAEKMAREMGGNDTVRKQLKIFIENNFEMLLAEGIETINVSKALKRFNETQSDISEKEMVYDCLREHLHQLESKDVRSSASDAPCDGGSWRKKRSKDRKEKQHRKKREEEDEWEVEGEASTKHRRRRKERRQKKKEERRQRRGRGVDEDDNGEEEDEDKRRKKKKMMWSGKGEEDEGEDEIRKWQKRCEQREKKRREFGDIEMPTKSDSRSAKHLDRRRIERGQSSSNEGIQNSEDDHGWTQRRKKRNKNRKMTNMHASNVGSMSDEISSYDSYSSKLSSNNSSTITTSSDYDSYDDSSSYNSSSSLSYFDDLHGDNGQDGSKSCKSYSNKRSRKQKHRRNARGTGKYTDGVERDNRYSFEGADIKRQGGMERIGNVSSEVKLTSSWRRAENKRERRRVKKNHRRRKKDGVGDSLMDEIGGVMEMMKSIRVRNTQ